jgi:hypothetical protein
LLTVVISKRKTVASCAINYKPILPFPSTHRVTGNGGENFSRNFPIREISRSTSMGQWENVKSAQRPKGLIRKMPLPYIKKFCSAICRSTQQPCKNSAAFGMQTCRYHGARAPATVRSGERHPQYKHGGYTKIEVAAYRAASLRLARLEEICYNNGWISGPKKTGRKPR